MKKNLIQKKLFLSFYTFLLFVILLLSIFAYLFIFRDLKNHAIKNILSSISSTKKNVEIILKIVESFDEVIYKNELMISLLKKPAHSVTPAEKARLDSFLDNFTIMNSFIKGIHIVGQNHSLFSSHFEIEKKMLDPVLSSLDPENRIKKISVDYYRPFFNYDIISYHLPIYDLKKNKILAILLIDISIDYFTELFITSVMESEEKILITDANDQILFHFPANIDFNYLLKNKALDQSKQLNENILVSSEKIKYSNWKYIRIIPLDRTIQKFSQIFRLMIFLLAIIVIIACFLTLKFSIIITQPIIELNKKFKEMEKGNLDLTVNFNSNDEIGELGLSFNKMIKELDQLIKKQLDDQKRKDELRFQILQSQINPHFLYNTLDSIRWMAIIQNLPNINDMVSSIINLLKYNISTEEDIVSIESELESVKNYLNIQKYRYGNTFSVQYELDQHWLKCKIIRFTLQPLIENSFYHAFNLEKKQGVFIIKLYAKDKNIILEIKDNGKGFDQQEIKKGNKMHVGIGLKSIDERIKLFFGKAYGLTITSSLKKGTTVQIKLPKQQIDLIESEK